MKKLFLVVLVCILTACSVNNEVVQDDYKDYVKVAQYCDRVFETGIYKEVDEDFTNEVIDSQFDQYFNGGGCTAIGKADTLDGMIIGRNMDLFISNKPSYIVKTDVPGRKKTIGLTYSNTRGEDYDVVYEHGVDPTFYSMIPFLQTDVMNEDGFYIEINMRYADYDENGNSVFSCSGTNPGKKRMTSFLLPYYLGSRCSSVDEALKIVTEDLDLYTPAPNGSGMDWNFCFMMADQTGKYGVLEIAQNKVVFNEAIVDENNPDIMPHGACQANYYITPEFYEIQKMKSGVGRVDHLKNFWPIIDTEEMMFATILQVSYFQTYFKYCQFNNYSEFIGNYEEDGEIFIGTKTPEIVDGETVVWDYDYVTNPKNEEYVKAYIEWIESRIKTRRTEDSLDDSGQFWESTFSLVANCNTKTLFVRFNESGKNIKYITFDNWED